MGMVQAQAQCRFFNTVAKIDNKLWLMLVQNPQQFIVLQATFAPYRHNKLFNFNYRSRCHLSICQESPRCNKCDGVIPSKHVLSYLIKLNYLDLYHPNFTFDPQVKPIPAIRSQHYPPQILSRCDYRIYVSKVEHQLIPKNCLTIVMYTKKRFTNGFKLRCTCQELIYLK